MTPVLLLACLIIYLGCLDCKAETIDSKGVSVVILDKELRLAYLESLLECTACQKIRPRPTTARELAIIEAIALKAFQVDQASELPDIYIEFVRSANAGYVEY